MTHRSIEQSVLRTGALLLTAQLAVGCHDTGSSHDVAHVKQDIVAGFSANSSSLNAVGSLSVFYEADGYRTFDSVCTATLISPTTALTAKHCVELVRDYFGSGYRFVFTVGPSAATPDAYTEVIDFELAPGDLGGFVDKGHDVGVLHFVPPITDVTPIPFAALAAEHVGTDFVGIGYGVQDNNETTGTRRLGTLNLRADSGRTFEVLLGNFNAFYEWYTGSPQPTHCDDDDAGGIAPVPGEGDLACDYVRYLAGIYETQRLETVNELVVGGLPGNALACFGDSGGPLLHQDADGVITTYAVTSGGLRSSQLACDYGNVYASFDPVTLAFITQAALWVDPCGGLSAVGVCDGSVAKRCTTLREGKRRTTQIDCALLSLSCETQLDGSIGCGSDDRTFAAPPQTGASVPPIDPTQAAATVFIPPGGELPKTQP